MAQSSTSQLSAAAAMLLKQPLLTVIKAAMVGGAPHDLDYKIGSKIQAAYDNSTNPSVAYATAPTGSFTAVSANSKRSVLNPQAWDELQGSIHCPDEWKDKPPPKVSFQGLLIVVAHRGNPWDSANGYGDLAKIVNAVLKENMYLVFPQGAPGGKRPKPRDANQIKELLTAAAQAYNEIDATAAQHSGSGDGAGAAAADQGSLPALVLSSAVDVLQHMQNDSDKATTDTAALSAAKWTAASNAMQKEVEKGKGDDGTPDKRARTDATSPGGTRGTGNKVIAAIAESAAAMKQSAAQEAAQSKAELELDKLREKNRAAEAQQTSANQQSMMKAFTDQMASAATDRREEAKLRAEEAKLRAESAKQQSQVQQALLSFLAQQAAK